MSGASLRVGYVAGWPPRRAPGLARYATELLAALRSTTPQHELVELSLDRTGAARLAWTQSVLPWRVRRAYLDVCHVTSYPTPVVGRAPIVLTLHDLSLLREPGTHPRRRVAAMTPLLRMAALRATAIIVPSRATRDDAERLLHLDPAYVHVIPEAASPRFRRVTDQDALVAIALRHAVTPGYLLALGTLEPRKNLPALVDAWLRVRARGWDGQLVLAGGDGWRNERLHARLADPAVVPHVRRLGHVADADLPGLLTMAGAFGYPSLLEGFGLPVVEALACGTPTVTADRGATAEVAGDAAILADPTDVGALVAALERALMPGPERDRLALAGPLRAARFDWDTAARATADVYVLAAGAAG